MKLSILIPALKSRPWECVYNKLVKQASNLDVEILLNLDNGQATSGVKRQELLDQSRGDYICYVDDDDDVADNYINKIYTAMNSGADVISFNLALYKEGLPREQWTLGCFPNSRKQGVMLVNHLCAWKRSLASKVSWCPFLGNSDDHLWSQPLYFAGCVKSNFHINEILYEYRFSTVVTQNQRYDKRAFALSYLKTGVRCFIYGDQIVIEHDPRLQNGSKILVRFGDGHTEYLPLNQLTLFHTVTG